MNLVRSSITSNYYRYSISVSIDGDYTH